MRKLLATVGVILFGLCLWLAAEAFWLCPTRLRVVEYDVPLAAWPVDGPAARVVVLADFHAAEGQQKWIRRVVQQTLELKPELILLLGDYVDAPLGCSDMSGDELAALLAPLAAACPVFYVCGNHDFPYAKVADIRPALNHAGFVCIESLPAQRVRFRNGHSADFKGSPMTYGYESLRPYYSSVYEDYLVPLIAVQHDPYHFLTRSFHLDAALCGHTHGGQFCLPGGYPMVSLNEWTPAMLRAGMRRSPGGFPVIISRGLGESTLPMRIACPPEIVLLRLRGVKPQ